MECFVHDRDLTAGGGEGSAVFGGEDYVWISHADATSGGMLCHDLIGSMRIRYHQHGDFEGPKVETEHVLVCERL
jgi:hypothetical protein